jgi:hypothetical protein
MDNPLEKAKEKAAATYDAAADHFDDEPLSFWDRVGKRTVAYVLAEKSSTLAVGLGLRRCPLRKLSGRTDP